MAETLSMSAAPPDLADLRRRIDEIDAQLHDLIIAAGGHHPGMLVVRFDNDPRHNLTDRAIGSAISKLESSSVPIPDRIYVLQHWR